MTTAGIRLDTIVVPADRRFFGHPVGLGYLAFTEAWERFSFFGMQALLVLYMVDRLLRPGHVERVLGFGALRAALEHVSGPLSVQALSSQIFGLYTALVYVTPVIGGIAADRYLGRRGAVTLGAVIMALGHFLMAVESAFLIALSMLVLGGGLIKGNIASQIGGLYGEHDIRRPDAFQIFLMSINFGAAVAPLVCGTLGELYGWHYGFAAAGIGMLVSLLIYLAGRRHMPPDVLPMRGPAVAPAATLTAGEWRTIGALVLLLPVLAIAFVANNQGFNVGQLWARESVDLNLGRWKMPVTWLLSIGTISAVISIPPVVWFWRRMAARNVVPHEITKLVIGCGIWTVVFGCKAFVASWSERTGVKIPLGVYVAIIIVSTVAYANFYPVSLALFARMAPKQVNSTVLGVFFFSTVGTNLLVGWIGGLYGTMSHGAFWGLHAALCAIAAVCFAILFRPLKSVLG